MNIESRLRKLEEAAGDRDAGIYADAIVTLRQRLISDPLFYDLLRACEWLVQREAGEAYNPWPWPWPEHECPSEIRAALESNDPRAALLPQLKQAEERIGLDNWPWFADPSCET
jgi:hypothetical protein